MLFKKAIALLFALSCAAMAQIGPPTSPQIRYTTSNPNGLACSSTAISLLTPSGVLYTCQAGFYAQVSGGGGSVSITATSPIVVTPSPTTGTGVISCPTCSVAVGNTVISYPASHNLSSTDCGSLLVFNGTTLSLTLASPPIALCTIAVENLNSTSLTIARNGVTINGGTSNVTLLQYQWTQVWTDGTVYYASPPISAGTGITITPAATTLALSVAASLPSTTSVRGTTIPASVHLLYSVANGSKAMATNSVTNATCATLITDTATGTLTTDTVVASFNGRVIATNGYLPGTMLSLTVTPSADLVNFDVCNNTGAPITPAAVTLNYIVVRVGP